MSRFRWLPTGSPFEERPFRRVFERVRRALTPDPEIVTAYTDGQVTLRSNRSKEGYHEAADLSGFQGVEVGDFVVHGLDILRGSVGVSDSVGALSSVCIVCVPRVESDPRFFAYAMRAQAWAGVPRALAKGVREGGADFRRWETLAELPLPAPSLHEQRALADHLDAETLHIDALISKKRRLIELLDERRSNFVSEAVTIGLESNGESVDTRNRYVRRIPKRWRLMRLRHVVEQIIDTPHKTAPVVNNGEYLVVRTSNVKTGRLILDGARYTDRASWIEWNHRGEPRPGDVLLTREAPAGEACVVPAHTPLCIGQRMVLLRVNQTIACGEWVAHSIYSGHVQRFIMDSSNATTVAHLNMSNIHDIPIAVPDLREQQQLLGRIRSNVRRHEETVSKLNEQIDLLAERRQALITAVVTGQIAVSELAKEIGLTGSVLEFQ